MKTQSSFSIIFLIALVCSQAQAAELPGVVLTVTEQAINDFLNTTFSFFNHNDTHVILDQGPLTVSTVNISNVTLTKLHVNPSNQNFLDVTKNNSISFNATGIDVDLTLHVNGKVLKMFSIDRDAVVSFTGGSISFIADFVCTDQNVLVPNISNFTLNYDKLSINMEGFSGKFLGLFVNLGMKYYAKNIKATIVDQIHEISQDLLKDWLQTQQNPSIPIPNTPLSVNLGFTACPLITADYMSFPFDGTVFDSSKLYSQPPLPEPSTMPTIDPDVASNSVQLFLSDYFFESAIYAYETSGYLAYTLTPEVAADSNVKLDTTTLSGFVPSILTVYEADQPAQITCIASADDGLPAVEMANGQINIGLPSTCAIQILGFDNSTTDAIVTLSLISVSMDVNVTNSSLTAQLTTVDVTQTTIKNSTLTGAKPAQVTSLLDTILGESLSAINSHLLDTGAIINVGPHAKIASVNSSIHTGYFEVTGTPLY
jgi:hypothetical protein